MEANEKIIPADTTTEVEETASGVKVHDLTLLTNEDIVPAVVTPGQVDVIKEHKRRRVRMTRVQFRKKRTSTKFRATLANTLRNHHKEKQSIKPVTRRQIKQAREAQKVEAQKRHARALLTSNLVE